MTLPGRVFHEHHFSGFDHAGFAVTDGNLGRSIEIDHVLPSRRGMPSEREVGLGTPKLQACHWKHRGTVTRTNLLDPLDLDVAKVRDAVRVRINVVNSHRLTFPYEGNEEDSHHGTRPSLRACERLGVEHPCRCVARVSKPTDYACRAGRPRHAGRHRRPDHAANDGADPGTAGCG